MLAILLYTHVYKCTAMWKKLFPVFHTRMLGWSTLLTLWLMATSSNAGRIDEKYDNQMGSLIRRKVRQGHRCLQQFTHVSDRQSWQSFHFHFLGQLGSQAWDSAQSYLVSLGAYPLSLTTVPIVVSYPHNKGWWTNRKNAAQSTGI